MRNMGLSIKDSSINILNYVITKLCAIIPEKALRRNFMVELHSSYVKL